MVEMTIDDFIEYAKEQGINITLEPGESLTFKDIFGISFINKGEKNESNTDTQRAV